MDQGWTRKYCYECSPHEDENCSHAQAVTIKRRAIKKVLIEYAGGKCQKCGLVVDFNCDSTARIKPKEWEVFIEKYKGSRFDFFYLSNDEK